MHLFLQLYCIQYIEQEWEKIDNGFWHHVKMKGKCCVRLSTSLHSVQLHTGPLSMHLTSEPESVKAVLCRQCRQSVTHITAMV